MPQPQPPLRALVIGAGPMADVSHLPALARLRDRGEVVLAIICDFAEQRADSARRKFGFLESTGDAIGALERQDIDLVYVFAAAKLHYEYGMLALENGKHLFVEKPVSPSHREAFELSSSARRAGLIAVGGLNRRFYKSMLEVRARAGATRWRYAEAVFHKAEFGHSPPFGADTFLSANGIHALDALLFMMGGVPEELTAFSGESGARVQSAFSAVMRWQDGAQGVFLCNNDAGSRREEYAFHAPGETYRIDDQGLSVEKNGTLARTASSAIGDGILAEHEKFIEAIRSGAEPIHSVGAIAPSMFVAELIESGFSGRVELPETIVAEIPARKTASQSILVLTSQELQAPLAELSPMYRLASLEDVQRSSDVRPDIVAAILGRGSQPLPSSVLDKLPQLAVVGIMGLSVARFNAQALLERGICVVNASDAYATTVAEFALGLAILGRRRAFTSDGVMRSGGWGTAPAAGQIRGLLSRAARSIRPVLRRVGLESAMRSVWRLSMRPGAGVVRMAPRELRGATVGLLGWGENARVFASHLIHAGAKVRVYTEHGARKDIQNAGAIPVSLGEALASDIVSLHRGLSDSTRHFLGEAELAKLLPGTVLINTARGALVDPEALLARLKKGDIFACLDTFENEPVSSSSPLLTLPNVFLTSHIAGGSQDMHDAAAREVVQKVTAFLSGAPVASVSIERLKTMS